MGFRFFLFLLFLFVLPAGYGCGNGDTIVDMASGVTDDTETDDPALPSISSLVDTGGNTFSETASENTTFISAMTTNTYRVTFDVPMDVDTLSIDNVTLVCDETQQTVTIDLAADSDGIENNEFDITASNRLPAYASCTLTFGTGVTSAEDTALTATAFTYTTKCATSDDFSDTATLDLTSGGCWGTVGTAAFSNSGSYGITNGILSFDGPNEHYFNTNRIIIYKTFTADDLTATIEFPIGGISGIDGGNDAIAIGIYEDNDDPTNYALVEHFYSVGKGCTVTPGPGSSSCSSDDVRGLRLVKTGTGIEGFWWRNSYPSYQSLGSTTMDVGTTYRVGIQMEGEAGNGDNNIFSIDSFTVSGAAAAGQDE